MELSRISTKHRGSSTGPTKNFRETCFTYTTNAQWHYVAPTLAWQYHFISCEGIQLGICFTLKGETTRRKEECKVCGDLTTRDLGAGILKSCLNTAFEILCDHLSVKT